MSIRIFELGQEGYDFPGFARKREFRALLDVLRSGSLVGTGAGGGNVRAVVREIITDVFERRDDALIDLTEKLDGVLLGPNQIRVDQSAIAAAHAQADPDFLALMRRAIANIRQYQESILVAAPPPLKRDGRTLSVRYTPIDRVGVYVPGGRAMYPSTVLMTVVPAKVAEVKQIALASPPTTDGKVNPMVLALAAELEVTDVYQIGGAQAIAALAIGTPAVRRVDKIVGPGNAFVAEAKRQLFGQVGIEAIAGPSEVLIIADETADPKQLAADMLAQAEHDPGSAVLVTVSRQLADEVAGQIDRQLPALDRAEAVRAAIDKYSCIVVTESMPQVLHVANDMFAPEHLQIITKDNSTVLAGIRNAAAIFLGPDTPVPVGDYWAGSSHVLPTGGTARFSGPLSCNDFLKASSVVEYDAASLRADAADIIDFATREGLTAHANAVRVRGYRDDDVPR